MTLRNLLAIEELREVVVRSVVVEFVKMALRAFDDHLGHIARNFSQMKIKRVPAHGRSDIDGEGSSMESKTSHAQKDRTPRQPSEAVRSVSRGSKQACCLSRPRQGNLRF